MRSTELKSFLRQLPLARERLCEESRIAQQRLASLDEVARIAQALRTSWSDEDPGKYKLHAFLIRDRGIADCGDGTLSRLLWVDPFHALELMEGYDESKRHNGRVSRITDAVRQRCTGCGTDQPIVGTYEQIEDGTVGDLWRMSVCLPCLTCVRAMPLAEAWSALRMSLSAPERR